MAASSNDVGYDMLNLSNNSSCQKMLHKQGSSFPEPECVRYSEKLIKINRKGKEQERALLVTDKAIYNLMPSDFSKCKRRIDLESIESVTISETSNEFAIHIPDEYDYRFKSANKDKICETLSACYSEKNNFSKILVVSRISQSSLLSVTVTKDASRLQTREERYKRYKQLLECEMTGSDEEEANEMKLAKPMKPERDKKRVQVAVNADDFEFLKVIGRGSFGKVMMAKKKDNAKLYAMKILKKKAIIARNQVEHTKSERLILQQLQQLQHPFLMKLRYAFQSEEKLYFVLDYYRGGELFFHLKKKRRFTEREAQIFVAEVALALGHLHRINVIYRDLKPENILLDDDGHICLTDFGLSKQQMNHSNLAHTFCGTPEYLAPEIVTNVGHSKAVDWWSLGVLLYELTIGIPPFYSQNVNEMYKKIQQAPLQFPPQTTLPCKSVICLLLERNPRDRLGSGHDDVDEIKRHPFFKNIDWTLLYERKIQPVYKPNVKSELDTSNFDQTFTSEPIPKTHESQSDQTQTSADNISSPSSSKKTKYKSTKNGHHHDNDDENMFEEFSFIGGVDDDNDD